MTREFYTYLHCKPNGDPFYVGKGHGRRRSHDFKRRNAFHAHVVAKYGAENILVYVFPCSSEAEAFSDEVAHIAQLRRDGYQLANLTDGGEGATGLKLSDATRVKIVASLTGRKQSDETREKRRLAMIGKNRRPMSPEQRAKVSKAKSNPSAELRERLSAASKARPRTPLSLETREKIAAAHRGKKRAPITEQARMNLSAAVTSMWQERKRLKERDVNSI